MPNYLVITDEDSKFINTQLIDRADWEDVRDEITALYKNGIVKRKAIQLSDNHYNLLGSILFSAMDKGLKGTKTKWFFPHSRENIRMLFVETTNEKIDQYDHYEIISFGFHFSPEDRLHFFLDFRIPSFFFDMLYETRNDLWEYFTKLFNITTSRFQEIVPHEDVGKRLLDNGRHGFYKFMKYLIATEIKAFSNPINRMDTEGTVQLTFFAWTDMDEMVEKMSKAIELSSKIYSYLLRRYHQKRREKEKRLRKS